MRFEAPTARTPRRATLLPESSFRSSECSSSSACMGLSLRARAAFIASVARELSPFKALEPSLRSSSLPPTASHVLGFFLGCLRRRLSCAWLRGIARKSCEPAWPSMCSFIASCTCWLTPALAASCSDSPAETSSSARPSASFASRLARRAWSSCFVCRGVAIGLSPLPRRGVALACAVPPCRCRASRSSIVIGRESPIFALRPAGPPHEMWAPRRESASPSPSKPHD